MKLRLYHPDNLNRCIEIFDSNLGKYFADYERAEYIKWITEKTDPNLYWVIENETKVVGCGGIFTDDKEKVVGLAWGMIHLDYHGKGYGSHLTKFRVEKMIADFSHLKIILNTSQHTYQFYEKMGFKVTKFTEKGFSENIDRYDMEYMR